MESVLTYCSGSFRSSQPPDWVCRFRKSTERCRAADTRYNGPRPGAKGSATVYSTRKKCCVHGVFVLSKSQILRIKLIMVFVLYSKNEKYLLPIISLRLVQQQIPRQILTKTGVFCFRSGTDMQEKKGRKQEGCITVTNSYITYPRHTSIRAISNRNLQ